MFFPFFIILQLDAPAGELVLRKIEDMGVTVHTRTAASDIVTSIDSATGSEVYKGLKVGESILPSDLVIFAIGISPRDDLARKSGLKCAEKGGIEVGDDLMTSAEGVYAIGECASWKGKVSSFSRIVSVALVDLTLTIVICWSDVRIDCSRSGDGGYPLVQPCTYTTSLPLCLHYSPATMVSTRRPRPTHMPRVK